MFKESSPGGRRRLVVERGHPLPLGPSVMRRGVNFSVFTRRATAVTLVLYPALEADELLEFPLDPNDNRTGDIWHAFVPGLDPGVFYGFRMNRDPNPRPRIDRFDPNLTLVDPYSLALVPKPEDRSTHPPGRQPRQWLSVVVGEEFGWRHDRPLNTHAADTIVYEMHVRGFTRHSSAGVENPGTYLGVIEKIPYLVDLGVTAIELMPVFQFDEEHNPFVSPQTGTRLVNYWGYDPISYFAPHRAYSTDRRPEGPVREFKRMVRALHDAGLEVILDVVFNHTGEGGENGPWLHFRGMDNQAYYIVDPRTGRHHNYSGCGNTVNCNHPVVRNMILGSLRYWVTEMHVDGFRFDLASILGRGGDGEPLADPPLLERIAADPVLAHSKLIAEAWDAAGLYQVGEFPNFGRWAEWNGKFRDDVRCFVRGEAGMTQALASRLSGSPDLYNGNGRFPHHSINFVTCHDGFTLADLVSYESRRNWANGENNRDGAPENHSWNCGAEGPVDNAAINALRQRQMRNFAVLLMLSQGVPMILAGDEMGRSQQGNNNAYCQDNEVSWIDWRLLERHRDLHRFFKLLIAFRKRNDILRGRGFVGDPAAARRIDWHGVRLNSPDWSAGSRTLGMHLSGRDGEGELYLMANSHWESHRFELPRSSAERRWRRFVDTFLKPPQDISEAGRGPLLTDQSGYRVAPRSVVVLVAR